MGTSRPRDRKSQAGDNVPIDIEYGRPENYASTLGFWAKGRPVRTKQLALAWLYAPSAARPPGFRRFSGDPCDTIPLTLFWSFAKKGSGGFEWKRIDRGGA